MDDIRMITNRRLSRRDALACGAYALGACAVAGLASTAAKAQVAKKASQQASGYQTTPKGGAELPELPHVRRARLLPGGGGQHRRRGLVPPLRQEGVRPEQGPA